MPKRRSHSHHSVSPHRVRSSRTKPTVDSLFARVLSSLSLTKAPNSEDYRTLLVRKSKLEKRREYDTNYSESSLASQVYSSYCDYTPISSSSECLPLVPLSKSPMYLSPISINESSGFDYLSEGPQDEWRKPVFRTDSLGDRSGGNLELSDDDFDPDSKAVFVQSNRRHSLLKKKSQEKPPPSLGSLSLAR
jgi:hypothetical protein